MAEKPAAAPGAAGGFWAPWAPLRARQTTASAPDASHDGGRMCDDIACFIDENSACGRIGILVYGGNAESQPQRAVSSERFNRGIALALGRGGMYSFGSKDARVANT